MDLLKIKRKRIRKSGFEDSIFTIVVIFAICIFILVLAKVWTGIKPSLDEGITSSMNTSSVNVSQTLDQVSSTTFMFDKLLPFILIGLFGFLMIGASLYFNHPIMLIVGIIILAVAIMLGIIYSNIYHQISSSDEFTSTNTSLPIQELFMKYLPFILIAIIVGIIAMIIYSRQGGSNSL